MWTEPGARDRRARRQRWTTRSGRRWRRATRSTSRSSCSARRSIGDEVLPDVRVQVPLSRVNRHGLIAGATGTGKTKTLQLLAGQLVGRGRPGLRRGRQGRPVRRRRARATRPTPTSSAAAQSLALDLPGGQGHPVEILSLSGKTGAHVRASVSPSGRCSWARSWTSTTPRPRSCRSSSATATTSTCRSWTSPTCGRPSSSWARTTASPSSRTWAASARRRLGVILRSIVTLEQEGADDLLRRARVRRGRPAAHHRRRQGHRDAARGRGRHGPAAPVLHVRAVDARPAVRAAARGGRPAEAQAGLLLRRGAPPVQGRLRGADGPDRAHRAPHPVQGRRASTSSPRRRPTSRRRSCRSWATGSSTRCAPSRPTTPTRCARPPARSR